MTQTYDTLGMPQIEGQKLDGPETLDGVLGFSFTGATEDTATGEVAFADRICQRFAMVHGGMYAALAEMVATEGTVHNVWDDGNFCSGLSNSTNFMRPITSGSKVRAQATARHRGRSTWIWDVNLLDDEDRVCAMSRVTIAVRPRKSG